MYPFVIDHRYTLEPSLAIYSTTRSAYKAATRGTKRRNKAQRTSPNTNTTPSTHSQTTPPAYTPPARTMTSPSTTNLSTRSSSTSTNSSTSSARSRLSRLMYPFKALRTRRRTSTTPSPSSSSSSSPRDLSPTTSTATTTRQRTRQRVRFAANNDYDSDASSVYSTDFAPDVREARRLEATRDVDQNRKPLPCFFSPFFSLHFPRPFFSVLVCPHDLPPKLIPVCKKSPHHHHVFCFSVEGRMLIYVPSFCGQYSHALLLDGNLKPLLLSTNTTSHYHHHQHQHHHVYQSTSTVDFEHCRFPFYQERKKMIWQNQKQRLTCVFLFA
jgi:hypothetical protein